MSRRATRRPNVFHVYEACSFSELLSSKGIALADLQSSELKESNDNTLFSMFILHSKTLEVLRSIGYNGRNQNLKRFYVEYADGRQESMYTILEDHLQYRHRTWHDKKRLFEFVEEHKNLQWDPTEIPPEGDTQSTSLFISGLTKNLMGF